MAPVPNALFAVRYYALSTAVSMVAAQNTPVLTKPRKVEDVYTLRLARHKAPFSSPLHNHARSFTASTQPDCSLQLRDCSARFILQIAPPKSWDQRADIWCSKLSKLSKG